MDTIYVSRYEFKYLVTPAQVPEVRRFLLRYCDADTNAGGAEWYEILSLYLDTPDYRLFRASSEKAVERLKLRVRGYANDAGPVKLEVKRRIGDVVCKQSMIVSQDMWQRFAAEGVSSLVGQVNPSSPFLRLTQQLRAAPRVLVRYQRHALYSDVDDYVRVTFDRNITCQPNRQWTLTGSPRVWYPIDDPASSWEDASAYVLELKFKVAPPSWLRDLVIKFGLVRRGFSKYVRSIRRAQADRDPEWDLRRIDSMPARVWRVA